MASCFFHWPHHSRPPFSYAYMGPNLEIFLLTSLHIYIKLILSYAFRQNNFVPSLG